MSVEQLHTATVSESSRDGRRLDIRRASHVEPDEEGLWWADLAPMNGPTLGPFGRRSAVLAAEREWLEAVSEIHARCRLSAPVIWMPLTARGSRPGTPAGWH